jgi:hypothetical protein
MTGLMCRQRTCLHGWPLLMRLSHVVSSLMHVHLLFEPCLCCRRSLGGLQPEPSHGAASNAACQKFQGFAGLLKRLHVIAASAALRCRRRCAQA